MGTKRWVERIHKLKDNPRDDQKDLPEFLQKFHQLIQAITRDFEELKFNTVIAKLMEMTNLISKVKIISFDSWKKFLIMLSPFLPFLAEKLWSEL
ncbi:MAG: class I tRNA ligase family protein [bacterium]|nr:class I tRNA ligase family protein [bacterium]